MRVPNLRFIYRIEYLDLHLIFFCIIIDMKVYKKMIKTGVRPIILGLIVWFVVSVVSILFQFVSGQI